jgi:hypothetical protein
MEQLLMYIGESTLPAIISLTVLCTIDEGYHGLHHCINRLS